MSDLISRQATIDALDAIHYTDREDWWAVFSTLENLPSAEPERIKGHWIEITLSNHTYKCSVCGRLLVNITDGKNNVAKNYPYCHCGAYMKCSENPNS